MSKTIEIPLNEINKWIDRKTTPLVEPLRAEAKNLLKDIQDKLAGLIENSDKLLYDAEKEIEKGNRKTFRPTSRI